jgi:hypothetical protein
VTNQFDPTINITNDFSVGNVNVTNIFGDTIITNIIENIAVAVTNTITIENITQVTTSGVSSINGEEGAITFEGSGVTQTGTVFNFSGGGGGGDVTINGVTTNAFTFIGQFPVSVSNIANTFYFGQLGGGTFIPAAGTNQVLNFVGSVTQTFTVPSGVTQLYVYAWGAGGGGSTPSGGAGGYSFGYFNVTTGEVLSVVIGEGGFVSSATASTAIFTNTLNPFPNGGWGAGRHTTRGGAGGGSSAIMRGTNFLVVAGGGGGGGVQSGNISVGGGGGGTSGQSGSGTVGLNGGGGTQSDGGSAGSTALALSITNTAGTFGLGGNAGLATNQVLQASGGGGGGWFGGGGAVAGAANAGGGGGGGSGYINTSQGVIGTTVQAQSPSATTIAVSQPPPATDDPLYGSPTAATWGRGGASNTAGSNGGIIIRWVEP